MLTVSFALEELYSRPLLHKAAAIISFLVAAQLDQIEEVDYMVYVVCKTVGL